ncbi:hypothetical protein ACN47E_007280 [Coniothyrium glycines]
MAPRILSSLSHVFKKSTDDDLYDPIDTARQTIRLLYIQPGRWDDKIKAELRTRPIAEALGSYVAISYTWGNSDIVPTVLIQCNGKAVPISSNLFGILRKLRHPDRRLAVWADALCINQQDSLERTHQVGLMGEIYKNSMETHIWLGEAGNDDDIGEYMLHTPCADFDKGRPRLTWRGDASDERFWQAFQRYGAYSSSTQLGPGGVLGMKSDIFGAFCLIQSFAEGTPDRMLRVLDHDKAQTLQRSGHIGTWHSMMHAGAHVQGSRSSRIWQGFSRIMSQPWWRRIWVIQETVLSRQAIVHFDMLSAPWSLFAKAAFAYIQQRHRLCLDLAGTFQGHDVFDRFSNNVLQIESTRLQDRRIVEDGTLLSLLWKFRPLEASDKRDKIFAVLGLTSNWQGKPSMEPDYSKSPAVTYLQTTIDNIQRSKTLSVLAGDLEDMLNRRRLDGIPSWVMDWSLRCLPIEIERINTLRMYNAHGDRTGAVRIHKAFSTNKETDTSNTAAKVYSVLEVEAVYIDTISAVGEVSRHTQISETCAVIRDCRMMTREYEERFGLYPTGESYTDAYWRTFIGDILATDVATTPQGTKSAYVRAKPEDADAFNAWRMWSRCISRDTLGRTATFSERDLAEGISAINDALKSATTSRRFFLTSNGYMGMGPKTCQTGDKIYVLNTSNVPFVLRPGPSVLCGREPCYTILGSKTGSLNPSEPCNSAHSCDVLVGDCFTHGLMNGEAFEQPRVRIGKLYIA